MSSDSGAASVFCSCEGEERMARDPRILLIRGGAIGDFVLTLPVLQHLRSRWPAAHIEVAGYPWIASLALETGMVQRVVHLEGAAWAGLFAAGYSLDAELSTYLSGFDIAIHFLYDPDAILTTHLENAGIPVVLSGSPRPPEGIHAADAMLSVLEALAIFESHAVPILNVSPSTTSAPLPASPWVSIHPGSGSSRKNWPMERFVAIANELRLGHGVHPVFVAGEADLPTPDFAEQVPGCQVLLGLPLPTLAGLLSGCVLHIGNDSGIAHLAAAVGVPVCVLFGPTDPDTWAPRGRAPVMVLRGERGRINNISLPMVLERVRELLLA